MSKHWKSCLFLLLTVSLQVLTMPHLAAQSTADPKNTDMTGKLNRLYCEAAGGCDEYIQNVSVGSINNTSGCEGYSDFTSLVDTMSLGGSSPINITIGDGWAEDSGAVWIDWDQNQTFDPDEMVLFGSGAGPYSGSVVVPVDAVLGETRMRVRLVYNQIPEPCDSGSYGEVEDYTINVTGLPPVITNCPGSYTESYCAVLTHDLDADDFGDPVTWSVNYGSINPVTGEWSFQPIWLGTFDIEITAENSAGTDLCEFEVDLLNQPPVFVSGCYEIVQATPGVFLYHQFDAIDPDDCDNLIYSLQSVAPTPDGTIDINTTTGLLAFEPTEADTGISFTVIVEVTDNQYDSADCDLTIDVISQDLPGDKCSDPIVIDSLPFFYTGSFEGYSDDVYPDSGVCSDDPNFGLGRDIFFEYTSAEAESLLIVVTPIDTSDIDLAILEQCDPPLCLNVSDSGGPGEDEWVIVPFSPASKRKFQVIETGHMSVLVFKIMVVKYCECDTILRPRELAVSTGVFSNNADSDFLESGLMESIPSLKQVPRWIRETCRFWYHFGRGKTALQLQKPGLKRKPIGIVSVRNLNPKARSKLKPSCGWVMVKVSGSYTVVPTEGQDCDVHCSMKLFNIGYEMSASQITGGVGITEAKLGIDIAINPFNQIYYTFPMTNPLDGSFFCPGEYCKSKSVTSMKGPVDMKELNWNVPYPLALTFYASGNTCGIGRFKAILKRLDLKIECFSKKPRWGAQDYSVEYDFTDVEFLSGYPGESREVSLPTGFGSRLVDTDSSYALDCLSYSTLPAFGSRLFHTGRINDPAYMDTVDLSLYYPLDSSALFTVSGNSADTFPTSNVLTAPSDIAFDTLGSFGNNLFVAMAEDSDSNGTPVAGSGAILSVDSYGNVDTLTGGLDSPVGLAFTSDIILGDNLYVIENGTGEITVIDPGGSASTFATGLKWPLDVAVSTGSYGNYLYVAEYDTTEIDGNHPANSGKIVRIDLSGVRNTFADALQAPNDLAFGPGGIFGTDLYVLLDNEYNDSTAYEPGTGKIVKIDPFGTVTDFATNLDAPRYLTFDPAGALYVIVSGGILKIAIYNCGDANGDETTNISDAVHIINYVFVGGDPPVSLEAGDVNCDGTCNVSDAVWIINYVFVGGNVPCDTNGDTVPDC
jgi:GEVED domain/Dockerin type I domain